MKVSVIIPAYNAGQFIGIALQSVLAQSHAAFEVIVVDDGSTDDTAAVVERFRAADQRITLLRHDMSRGPSAARNTAIGQASGDWLALLDADDQFAPDRLARLLTIAGARELDVLADNLAVIDFVTRAPIGPAFEASWFDEEGLITLDFALRRDWPGIRPCEPFGYVKPIIRREFLRANGLRYDETVRIGEDLLFYAELILLGARFGLTGEAHYIYSKRGASLSYSAHPTVQLLQASKSIRRRLSAVQASVDNFPALMSLVKRREQALWWEDFVWCAKAGQYRAAAAAVTQMNPLYFSTQMAKPPLRRINRLARRAFAGQ